MPSHKYYWLRLNKDFFKRHDVRIIEAMPNGKDYILFYLKLLVESVSHEGELRFSDTIPYSAEMLATVTDTNVDIVRSAVKIFEELNMLEVMDDATIYMTEVNKMIGSTAGDEHTKESTRERVRRYRERQKQLQLEDITLQERYSNVTCNGEIEKEIEKEIEIDNKPKRSRFVKPSLEEVKAFIKEKGYNVNADTWYLHYESNGWKVGRNSMKDWKACVAQWNSRNMVSKPKNSNSRGYDFEALEKELTAENVY